MLLNAHHEAVPFTLPDCAGGQHWSRVFDTAGPHDETGMLAAIGEDYPLTARSLALFALGA